jgi:hypothetical protein
VYGVQLNFREVSWLSGNGQLTDNIIEALMNCISSKCMVLVPRCCQGIFLNGRLDIMKRNNFKNKYIPGSANKDGNHWVLVFIDNERAVFYFIDPFCATHEQSTTAFNIFLNFAKTKKDIADKNWKLGEFKHSKQSDGVSCGVICLMLFEKLTQNKTSLDYTPNDIRKARLDYTYLLVKKNKQ